MCSINDSVSSLCEGLQSFFLVNGVEGSFVTVCYACNRWTTPAENSGLFKWTSTDNYLRICRQDRLLDLVSVNLSISL